MILDFKVNKETKQNNKADKDIFIRLFSYLLQYPIRLSLGLILALIVSLSNLLLLGGLVPILNIINSPKEVIIFTLTQEEKDLLKKDNSKDEQEVWKVLQTHIVQIKNAINLKIKTYSAREAILILCTFLFPLHFLKMVCLTATLFFLGTIGLAAVRNLRMEIYEKIQNLDINFFNREKTGMIMSRTINDGETIGRLLSSQFNEVLIEIFYVVVHASFLIWISWKMTLLILILVPILTIPIRIFSKRVRRATTKQQKSLADLIGHIQESISGIRVTRAFGMKKAEYRRFRMTNWHLYKNTFTGHYYHQVAPALTEVITIVFVLIFFFWGAYEMSIDNISRGLFFTFFFAIIFVVTPLKRISTSISLFSAASAPARRIFNILDEEIKVVEIDNPKQLQKGKKTITFKKVSFGYPNSKINSLKNINLNIHHGEHISLLGASGAGKSTIVNLLMRLYDVSSGNIYINGIDIRELSIESLRSSIAVMSQDIFLFNASVSENISCGSKEHTTQEKIEEAAKKANAHEFIQNLEKKYNTLIGERGVMLSGGQCQRLAMARVLLLDPSILILDEATSNLDNKSEALIQETLKTLCLERTVITIAHRFSSIRDADRIIVIKDGSIIEEGKSHEGLLEKKGAYYNLYRGQESI